MKKRLILRGLLTIVICIYALRWNRELDIPEVDESLFNLNEETPIPKEENLGYTLQSSGAKEIFALIKDTDRENVSTQRKYGFHTFFKFKALLEKQSQLPENILQSKYAKEILGKNEKLFTGSIEEYFSGLNFLTLQEQVNKKGILPEIIAAIRSQQVYIDSYADFPLYYTGAMQGSAGDQTFGKYLNTLALRNTHHGNYQKGFEALQVSFLMGHKGCKNKSIIYSLIGAVSKSNALQTLHYMIDNYELPQEILSNYQRLLGENQADPEEIFSNVVKGEYQMTKSGIQYLDKLNKRELFDMVDFLNEDYFTEKIFALLLVKSKLFDPQETGKILNFYFKKVLTKEDNSDYFFKTFCEEERSVMPHIFQRKNIAGIKFLCSILPSTKGYYETLQSIDAYQHYLYEYLEQKANKL